MSLRGPTDAEVRALLRGVHGPEATTTPDVALMVHPHVRRLVDDLVAQLGRDQAESGRALEAWARSIEVVAAAYRASLSAQDAARGHLVASIDDLGHGDTRVRSMTTAEAAEALGVTPRTVRRLCGGPTPALRSTRVGRDLHIDPESIDHHLATRRRTA